jgi:hypothetical protein
LLGFLPFAAFRRPAGAVRRTPARDSQPLRMTFSLSYSADRAAHAERREHRGGFKLAALRRDSFSQHVAAGAGHFGSPVSGPQGSENLYDSRALADLSDACPVEVKNLAESRSASAAR